MDKTKTIDLGELKGTVLCFGGVYSNLQALESLKEICESKNIEKSNILCTGDIVGYCAQPEECIQFIREWGIASISGNVEIQLGLGADDCGCDFRSGSRCDSFSKRWYPYARSRLSSESLNWISNLPEVIHFDYKGKKALLVHGSPVHVSEYIFKSTSWQYKEELMCMADAELLVAGHSGLPFIHVNKGKIWLNPGVIGMPANDGTSRVWYATLESSAEHLRVRHSSFEYDFLSASRLMLRSGLPGEYADTLISGVWDNTEILPIQEAALSGQFLVLEEYIE